jgi:acyl carrier protein
MKATVTTLQELVAATWSEILQVEVGPYDTFSDLGGTAVDAVLIGDRLSDRFGVKLPLKTVFTNKTVAEFTLALGSILATNAHLPGRQSRASFLDQPSWPRWDDTARSA